MKTICLFAVLLGATNFALNAQNATSATNVTSAPASKSQLNVPASTAFHVLERGANHRVWQRQVSEKRPDGKVVKHSEQYIELASGMHYKDANGNWADSQELVEAYPGGAIARHGQYQVIFASNLNSEDAIDQQTPDGKRLRSNMLGLAYYDSSSDQSVMIAQVQDSEGELISSNQVLYPNAFAGVKADVRYTYKKGSFEQDVILREQPPTPESLGLSSGSTEIQVLTEFVRPPRLAAERHHRLVPVEQDISWGAMRLGRGKAFDLGHSNASGPLVTVARQYVDMDGRKILVERVPLKDIQPSVSNLPRQASLNLRHPLIASKELILPRTPPVTATKTPLKLAVSASVPSEGYVLDYVELNSDQDDITFEGDMTYYISDIVNIDGTATFEGGAVIKFDTSIPLYLGLYGDGVCNSSTYRPVILTSQNDDTVGQAISDPDKSLFYFWTGLAGPSSDDVAWHDIHVRYAQFGMDIHSLHLSDSTFADCLYPIVLDQATGGSLAATNLLIERSGDVFSGANFNAKVYQLTVNAEGPILLSPGRPTRQWSDWWTILKASRFSGLRVTVRAVCRKKLATLKCYGATRLPAYA